MGTGSKGGASPRASREGCRRSRGRSLERGLRREQGDAVDFTGDADGGAQRRLAFPSFEVSGQARPGVEIDQRDREGIAVGEGAGRTAHHRPGDEPATAGYLDPIQGIVAAAPAAHRCARIDRIASRAAHDGDVTWLGQKSLTARIFDEPRGPTGKCVLNCRSDDSNIGLVPTNTVRDSTDLRSVLPMESALRRLGE